jgi:hypothetical protein
MIEKRLKKLWKLSVLIGIRQLYFLGRNLYLLAYQPYLTLKVLKDQRDKSQLALLAVTAITPTIVYILARIIWDLISYHRILWLTGKVFLTAAGIQTVVLLYLGFWVWRVIKGEKNVD